MPRRPFKEFEPHIELLLEMLQHKRPYGSATERAFIERYLLKYRPFIDPCRNLIVRIKGPGDNVLWSCHTDTVHNEEGYQNLYIDATGTTVRLSNQAKRLKAECLGADDGAGVWIMTQMIEAGKPGLYVFHYGEERGGIGSAYIRDHTPKLTEGIDFAIAFDRRGEKSVITRQHGWRCCSDEFADSLIAALPSIKGLEKDTGGSFTDTANYVDLIGECTNLSVGYTAQHGESEELNVKFLDAMREAIINLDVSKLVKKREAGEKEVFRGHAPYFWHGDRRYWNDDYADLFADNWKQRLAKYNGSVAPTPLPKPLPKPLVTAEMVANALEKKPKEDTNLNTVNAKEAGYQRQLCDDPDDEEQHNIADLAELLQDCAWEVATILLYEYQIGKEELEHDLAVWFQGEDYKSEIDEDGNPADNPVSTEEEAYLAGKLKAGLM